MLTMMPEWAQKYEGHIYIGTVLLVILIAGGVGALMLTGILFGAIYNFKIGVDRGVYTAPGRKSRSSG